MASALYNKDILRLATSLAGADRLPQPDASADRRSPTCGSRVIVDVRVDEQDKLSELGLDVRACALGQASAALMSAHAAGKSAAELAAARDALTIYLAGTDETGACDFWPGMEIFAPARAYPARHASILLAFEAVAQAMAEATSGVPVRAGAENSA